MNDLNQLLLNFKHKQNFHDQDFFVSKSNFYAYEIIENWPRWEKNVLNLYGEKYSGKTHLANIFIKKYKGKKINSENFSDDDLKQLKLYENIILDSYNNNIDERLLYALFNLVDQSNKYLVINSLKPINEMNFNLKDLKSRAKNSLVAKIEDPDDQLIKVLLAKNFSDRQIKIDNKLIEFAVKRITRSYGKIFEFIYKIDEMSLKMKKSIDLKTVKKVLKV